MLWFSIFPCSFLSLDWYRRHLQAWSWPGCLYRLERGTPFQSEHFRRLCSRLMQLILVYSQRTCLRAARSHGQTRRNHIAQLITWCSPKSLQIFIVVIAISHQLRCGICSSNHDKWSQVLWNWNHAVCWRRPKCWCSLWFAPCCQGIWMPRLGTSIVAKCYWLSY